MIYRIKKVLRPLYYFIFHNKVVTLNVPIELNGFRWIINARFGRAYYKGYYEPKIVQYFIANVKDGDCLLDAGAHAGYFSYLFSKLSPKGTIFSFEPDAKNIDFIKRIIEINDITNIELVPKALSSRSEKLSFTPGPTSSTGTVSKSGSLGLDAVAIDDIFLTRKVSKSLFIKIDVEGFGGEVIRGALTTIVKYKPTILMEIHENSDERNSLSALSELGYKFFNLGMAPENADNLDCRFFIAKTF